MNCRFGLVVTPLFAALALGNACSRNDPRPVATQHAAEEERAALPPAKERSDLDVPIDELFQRSCEHGRKTVECESCRYEAGVVRAPTSLFRDGLLKAAPAERRRLGSGLALTGELSLDERRVTHVSSQSEGVIQKVFVSLGDALKAGQPLLELESIAVGEAQGAFLEAQALLTLAERNAERVAQLRGEGIASERESFQTRQEGEAARIRTESALGKLVRLGMQPMDARSLTQAGARGRILLRAPGAGSVLAMHAVPGELAKAEESLITLGDAASLWVWADVYERDVARVLEAQARGRLSALVRVRAFPGESFSAQVDRLSPVMDEFSRTAKLRIQLPNPKHRLLAGMFAEVELVLPESEGAEVLVLPEAAVLEDEGRTFVFVHHGDDLYVRRPITPGRSVGGWIEVVRGLSGQERVVVEGAFLFKSDVLRSKMGAGCAD